MRDRIASATRLLVAGMALGVAAGAGAGAAAASHQVRKGEVVVHCPMTVGGSFQARTAAVSGDLTLGAAGAVDGVFSVDLATLDTGIDLRSRHLRENYLEVGKGEGFATATLSAVKIEAADPGAFEGKTGFKGSFQLHGQTREIAGTAEIHKEGDRRRVEATFPLRVSDFAIPKPSYLGVGVKNEIQVRVSLEVAPVAGSR